MRVAKVLTRLECATRRLCVIASQYTRPQLTENPRQMPVRARVDPAIDEVEDVFTSLPYCLEAEEAEPPVWVNFRHERAAVSEGDATQVL